MEFITELVNIENLTPYKNNAKKHPQQQIDNIAKSIIDFGWQQPIVADAYGVIIIGHGRWMAAKQLGIERLYLKQGKMFLYFVDESNQAYYHSQAFGRVLSYLQLNVKKCELREKSGKRSMVVSSVDKVHSALEILTTIQSLPSL